MVNTNTSNVLRNCEIVSAFDRENCDYVVLLLRKASIHRSSAEPCKKRFRPARKFRTLTTVIDEAMDQRLKVQQSLWE